MPFDVLRAVTNTMYDRRLARAHDVTRSELPMVGRVEDCTHLFEVV